MKVLRFIFNGVHSGMGKVKILAHKKNKCVGTIRS